jgi:DNA-binding XRE family transcriptional regulator
MRKLHLYSDDHDCDEKGTLTLQQGRLEMTIFYDKDRDYAEVFFRKDENYGEELNVTVTIFRSEKNDKVVGYAFEDASHSLFESDALSSSVKLAALLKMIRAKEELTQEAASEMIGDITLRHYQRLEAGEDNPTLSTVENLMKAFAHYDFSQILKHPAAVA